MLGTLAFEHIREDAMNRYMRGPGSIIGIIIVIVVIFLVLRLLGLV